MNHTESSIRDWQLREDGHHYDTIAADSATEALAVAEENVDRSNYNNVDGTIWIDVRVYCPETGEEAKSTVTLEAPEPDCVDSNGHDWQSPHALVGGIESNPGVWGHGGGVIIHEVCLNCGCSRHTDTWAQRPDTGEQGLRSVSYEPEAFSIEEIEEALG